MTTDPVLRLTRDELLARAAAVAHDLLGVSTDEAFARLDRGELAGSLAGPELRMLRDMLDRTR